MPDLYKASPRQACAMAVPFRIPKKKQPSDASGLDMQSPLSRLQDCSSPRTQWGSVTHNGKTSHKSSFNNGNTISKHSQTSDTVRSPDARTSTNNILGGSVRGKISFTLNKQPIKISPARVNGTVHKGPETGSSRANCQTPTTGRDLTGSTRWRPKRASDTLCRDENHMGACESPSFKIRRDASSGKTELSELFHDEEDIEETQGPSRVLETQRLTSPEDAPHISKTERRLMSTGSGTPPENTAKQGKSGKVNEGSTVKPSNHRTEFHAGHHVREEKAGLRTFGERAALPVPVRKDPEVSPPEAKSEDPFNSFYSSRLSRKPRIYCRTYKRTKPSSTEPIVLSSDDDGSDEGNDESGSLRQQQISESTRDAQMGKQKSPKANTGSNKSANKVEVPSIMELSFSTLLYDTVEAQSNGTIVITDDGITIPLKGADGEGEIAVSVTCSQLRFYGVWDGALARDGSLLPSMKDRAPSLLFLVVSDAQAKLMQKELSVVHSVHSSGQACPFVLLVLADQLGDLQVALLASLMDLIGLKHGQSALSNTLSWADGLNRLHCHPRGVNLLSVLGQNVDDAAQETAEKSAGGSSSRLGELPGVRRPLRSHSRIQSLPRRLIQYPPPPSKGGITVTTEDLECLKEEEFLNDVIIDFYLKFLLLERADKDVAERSHIFSSFFYKQLTRKDNPGETGSTARYRRHQRVRTWTRHVDIFSKDYLFIPVNQEAHWYLVVICFPGLERPQYVQWRGTDASQAGGQTVNTISAGECKTGSSCRPKSSSSTHNLPNCTVHSCTRETVCRRPCILIMDSLKLSYHHGTYTLLREYLQVEWEVRKQTPRAFTNENISGSPCRVPLQDNSSDCGLYLLQYVESFLQNPVVHFELPLRLEHWFPRNQVRRKREELRELVLQLYRRQGGGAEQTVQ